MTDSDDQGTPHGGQPNDRPASAHVLDVGLQHERTALAWDRTGLSFLVVGTLTIRHSGMAPETLPSVVGCLAMAVGALLLWAGTRRYQRREADLRHGASPVRPRLVRLTGAAAIGISLASLLLVVT
jgi:uncharacterized membrane protein YidH (DUF202 family)